MLFFASQLIAIRIKIKDSYYLFLDLNCDWTWSNNFIDTAAFLLCSLLTGIINLSWISDFTCTLVNVWLFSFDSFVTFFIIHPLQSAPCSMNHILTSSVDGNDVHGASRREWIIADIFQRNSKATTLTEQNRWWWWRWCCDSTSLILKWIFFIYTWHTVVVGLVAFLKLVVYHRYL